MVIFFGICKRDAWDPILNALSKTSKHARYQKVPAYNHKCAWLIQSYNCNQRPVGLFHAKKMAEVALLNVFTIWFPASFFPPKIPGLATAMLIGQPPLDLHLDLKTLKTVQPSLSRQSAQETNIWCGQRILSLTGDQSPQNEIKFLVDTSLSYWYFYYLAWAMITPV